MKNIFITLITIATVGMSSVAQADTQFPTLKLDGSGNAQACWLNSPDSDNQYKLQTSFAPPTSMSSQTTWQGNVTTHTGTLNSSIPPALGVNANGDAVLVWADQQSTDSFVVLYAKTRPATTQTWSSVSSAITGPGGVLDNIQVNINETGTVTVLYTGFIDTDMSNTAEFVTTSTLSTISNTWSTPAQISP